MPERGRWRYKCAGRGWIHQVERVVHCKCEFGLSTTYNTALNPFAHTLMHMRARIGTHLRAWSLDAQTGCENGRFKERPAAAEAARRLPRSRKRFIFIYFFPRTSLCLLPFSAPLPGAWIHPSIELCAEVSNSAADINQNQQLRAASIRHRAHNWDFWRRDITAQRDRKPEQATERAAVPRARLQPAHLIAALLSDELQLAGLNTFILLPSFCCRLTSHVPAEIRSEEIN